MSPDVLTPPEQESSQDQGHESWKVNKSGKEYTSRGDGTNAPLYRQGDETPAQARERYAKSQAEPKKAGKGGDKRPKRKINPPRPHAPKEIDLKEIELQLAEALKAPAIVAAMQGDDFLTDHFTTRGPYLARNLVAAAEHNPWLRKKLEGLATGDALIMEIVTLIPLFAATVMYVAPPIIYLTNANVPNSTRERFGIPPRREAPNSARHTEMPLDAPVIVDNGTQPTSNPQQAPGPFRP